MNILIAIGSCQEWEANGCNQSLRDTWVKDIPGCTADGYSVRLVDYKFFHGRGAEAKPDVVVLDVPDDRQGIVRKTHALHQWATARDYDFVFQCWADTYVDVAALLLSGFENHDYMGAIHSNVGAPHAQYGFLLGGTGWWTSRRACKAICDAIPSEERKYDNGKADDLWAGDVIGASGCRMSGHKDYGKTTTLHGSECISPYNPQWMYDTHAARR